MNCDIRPIRIKEHYALISGMMRALHVSEQELFNKTADWDTIEVSYMRHIIEMQEDYNGTCLIAYVDNEPAGFTFGYEDEEGDSRIEVYEGKDLYVSDGYIKPEYRRMGIYKLLNEQLEAIYIEQGIRRIVRYTLTSNLRMQQFLALHKYQPVRLFYEKWITPDGKGVEEIKLTPPDDIK